ncbi:HamA C-terminal domain-containing protein [Cloacibacillus evryensis]|jgi:hypothetical protein|uniref:HamA C-terminal domain-containing protein n=1 Tax=Cloacibacillus evryensis TaxID=508460 RepID=UPI000240DFC5|nr:DUF1837 domain-containing protein [Cloacibacillus evryensis]EHL65421.1 hypothetical protein HMPREF1006_00434 [Synergistes sp. 3_1_syn1]
MSEELQKTIKSGKFDSVFTEVPHAEKLGLRNPEQLRLFHLNVQDNKFSSDGLIDFLRRNIGQYVFSRAKIEEFRVDDNLESIVSEAIRVIKKNGTFDEHSVGSFGGIMLYVFLEQILGAPKIMSKVELATNAKQYESKCDGIHLLSFGEKYDTPYYHMVFGTSSVTGDMRDAIDSAFEAIIKIEAQGSTERTLAENTVFAKSFDEGTIKHIKDLLIPTKGRQAAYDTAYGVFLGYSIGLDGSKYPAVEYRKILAAKMKVDIQNHAAYIAEKIHKLNLSNHSFYFYVLPLNNADTDRVEMMKQIVE